MPRVIRQTKPKCFKCQKTIRRNQKYSKCIKCSLSCHNKCLFRNRRNNAPTNENWICPTCTASENRNTSNAEHAQQIPENQTTSQNETNLINAQTLNELFENRENDEEVLSNDIYVTTEDFNEILNDTHSKKSFTSVCFNIRSLSNDQNLAKLESLLSSFNKKPDILGVCETWLRTDQTGAYMSLPDYTFLSNSRNSESLRSPGGGVGIYVKSHLNYNLRTELTKMTYKSLFMHGKMNHPVRKGYRLS